MECKFPTGMKYNFINKYNYIVNLSINSHFSYLKIEFINKLLACNWPISTLCARYEGMQGKYRSVITEQVLCTELRNMIETSQ